MANQYLFTGFMPLAKNSFSKTPITMSVEDCCELMGISRSTFYRRQKQRCEAHQRILAGENLPELHDMLLFPELLSDGFGTRMFIRYADLIRWSEQLKGRIQA